MKIININLHIYGIPVKGTISIDEKPTNGINADQSSIFDEMKKADGFERTELLNHNSRQTVARGLKERICSTDGCFKKIYSKGKCSKHYMQDWKTKKGGENNVSVSR